LLESVIYLGYVLYEADTLGSWGVRWWCFRA